MSEMTVVDFLHNSYSPPLCKHCAYFRNGIEMLFERSEEYGKLIENLNEKDNLNKNDVDSTK